MTTKPSIPSARISHMKSKRRWPGVPNRYRIRSSSTVMRPKSIATVVCSLTFSASEEILRSLETTSISLIEPTNWVLPELNGPVTTIFTVCVAIVPHSRLVACHIAMIRGLIGADALQVVDQAAHQRAFLIFFFGRERLALLVHLHQLDQAGFAQAAD